MMLRASCIRSRCTLPTSRGTTLAGRMVAYDMRWNFLTGKYDEAAARGVAFMGLTGRYTWVTTKAEQLITHGVEPKT